MPGLSVNVTPVRRQSTSPSRASSSAESSPVRSLFDNSSATPTTAFSSVVGTPTRRTSGDKDKLDYFGAAPVTPSRPKHALGPQPAGWQWIDRLEDDLGQKVERSFEWTLQPLHEIDIQSPDALNVRDSPMIWRRRMGPTEASYYLGSRGTPDCAGINDMYLHIVFKAKRSLVTKERMVDIWTLLRYRHPLMASFVDFRTFDDIHFEYLPPTSLNEARGAARNCVSLQYNVPSEAIRNAYLNGERLLSDKCLTYLSISTPEFEEGPADEEILYDFHFFSTHFIGDGMALHTTANELFGLLSSNPELCIERAVQENPLFSQGPEPVKEDSLAQPQENLVQTPAHWDRLAWLVAQAEHVANQKKQIGGHSFARAKRGGRHTVVPTVSYDLASTKKALGKCKAHGVSITHALFSLSNMAYIRSTPVEKRDEKLPTMMYSALNIRQGMKEVGDWYRISISYFNIILPAFMPKSISAEQTFWHRCAVTKAQTLQATKSRFITSRSQLMAIEREQRSIGFERAEIEKAQRTLVGLGISNVAELPKRAIGPAMIATAPKQDSMPRAPSTALMGLSMLGNLDGMYKHATYEGIELTRLTSGSRQRPGALLLFAYTFLGKLWLCLGYDQNGFAEGVIENWWSEVLNGIDEFLLA